MGKEKSKETLEQLGEALKRLNEALHHKMDANHLVIDATIQRFEFTFELLWKTLQKILSEKEKIEAPSPKRVLQAAFSLGWIKNEKSWLKMLEDRNLTSHAYQEELAFEIYKRTKQHYPKILSLYDFLKQQTE